MKHILVIDPSPAVRESLALLLARDYQVEQRDSLLDDAILADAVAGVDLVIASSGSAAWTAALARLAAQANLAVLLLVESEPVLGAFAHQGNLRCLAMPFNPYDLKAAVESLLSVASTHRPQLAEQPAPSHYLEFPFVSRGAALLARRFAPLSLPVLIWGERGCGQDRVARAMLGQTPGGVFLSLNGLHIAADYLRHQQAQLAASRGSAGAPPTLLIEGLEQLAASGQSLLLNFLDETERIHGRLRLVATANADLLERVYRGDFLARLYYRLAKLTLPLAPLRRRRADLPALVRRLAGDYLTELGLTEIDFTPAALARLGDYLWFGNLDEFDMVIARTLAIHGKDRIEAADIVFDMEALVDDVAGKRAALAMTERDEETGPESSLIPVDGSQQASAANGIPVGSPELRLLVHELAHELKNPMVTIKTFAQLLAERYDDASFRASFQDVVDGDIERMNELLGVMTEYAGFDQPRKIATAFVEHLNSTLDLIRDACGKRQVHVSWKGNGRGAKIMADAAQLHYALKNTLLAVVSQAKTGSAIEVDLAESGALVISYLREGERMRSLDNYLQDGDLAPAKNIVPLRIILARQIVERSGGRFDINETDANRDVLTMEFPVV